jgi:hypothetical protein
MAQRCSLGHEDEFAELGASSAEAHRSGVDSVDFGGFEVEADGLADVGVEGLREVAVEQ